MITFLTHSLFFPLGPQLYHSRLLKFIFLSLYLISLFLLLPKTIFFSLLYSSLSFLLALVLFRRDKYNIDLQSIQSFLYILGIGILTGISFFLHFHIITSISKVAHQLSLLFFSALFLYYCLQNIFALKQLLNSPLVPLKRLYLRLSIFFLISLSILTVCNIYLVYKYFATKFFSIFLFISLLLFFVIFNFQLYKSIRPEICLFPKISKYSSSYSLYNMF